MATFEPVLSRNWNVPTAIRSRCMSRAGATRPRARHSRAIPTRSSTLVKDSELRGRGGAGFPCGLKWTFLPKDRKETLMCVNADESEPATFNNRLLMEKDPHQFLEGILIACFATKATHGLSLPAIRVHPRLPDPRGGDRRGPGGRAPGQEHLRLRLQPRRLAAPRRGGLHLRRGDRADREPRREAGLAADQAAVPGDRRGVPQADGRQQRRDALLRSPHHRARRELVQVDRHAQELRTEALLRLGPREQAGLRRAAAGHHLPRLDRRARRRRLEGPEGQGRRAGRDQHGPALGRRARHAARLREPAQAGLPRPGNGRRHRDRRPDRASSTTSTTPAGSSPTRAAASAPPAARGPAGSTRRSSGSRPAAAGSRTSTSCCRPGQQHGDHPGHDDLRPGRRRRLADQERRRQVPRRARRVHPDPPGAGARGHAAPGERSRTACRPRSTLHRARRGLPVPVPEQAAERVTAPGRPDRA